MAEPEDSLPLPALPVQGQNPYFEPRNAWDEEVQRRLEGYLSPDGLSSTIAEQAGTPTTTVVLFGTSLEAQNGGSYDVTNPANGTVMSAVGWFHWFNAYSLDSFTLVRNAGVGGNTYAQMLARMESDVLAYPSDWIFMGGPANDVAQGRSAAAIIADLDVMLDMAAGRRVLLLTTPPSASYDTSGKIGVLYAVNEYIAGIPATRRNVVVVDVYKLLADVATSAPATGMATDTVHYSANGALLIGQAVAQVMTGRYVPRPIRPAAPNDPQGVLTNPLSSGGSGWSVAGHGLSGSSVTAAYNARADGFGFSADATISGATVDDTYGVQAIENISGGRFQVGDAVWGEATLEWSGITPLTVAAYIGPMLRLMTRKTDNSFPRQYSTMFAESAFRRIPARYPSTGRVRLRTPRLTVDSGVDRIYFGGFLGGAAAGLLKITDANVFKI